MKFVDRVLTKAKTALVLRYPFWATLALQMKLEEDPSCSTGYTDGTKIAYNPGYIGGLTEQVVVSFLAHEVAHPALMHHLRCNGRDHERWNQACDYAVNLLLKDSGLTIPDSWLCDESYRDMSAEKIYELLPKGQGTGPGCGPGEVRPYPGPAQGKDKPSASEIRQQEADWKVKLASAAQAAKAQGSLGSGLERMVKELTSSRVNWKAVLASYIGEALDQDYSWKRPNVRYSGCGVILPSLVEREGGNVLVVLDTSGSVSEDDMGELATEIQGIISSYEIELDVLYVDSKLQGHQRFRAADMPIRLEPKGGGGTDYRPGFEWARESGVMPCCCVYLTDGWCSKFPKESPLFPVLWVLGGDSVPRKFRPSFGEVIRMGG